MLLLGNMLSLEDHIFGEEEESAAVRLQSISNIWNEGLH